MAIVGVLLLVLLIFVLFIKFKIAVYIMDSSQTKLDFSESTAKLLAFITFFMPPVNLIVGGALAIL